MPGPTIKGINSIANDLVTNDSDKALSAAQGVVLKAADDAADAKIESWVPQGYIYGLELEYATAGTLTVKAGVAKDDADSETMALSADITKNVLSAWVAGDTNGAKDSGMTTADGDNCHVFLIKNPGSGVVDVLVSNSFSSPTLPSGFTLKRWIGALVFSATNTLPDFVAYDGGEWIEFITPVTSVSEGAVLSWAARTLEVPTGKPFLARIGFSASTGISNYYISNPDLADSDGRPIAIATSSAGSASYFTFYTDASAQIEYYGTAAYSIIFYSTGYKLSR